MNLSSVLAASKEEGLNSDRIEYAVFPDPGCFQLDVNGSHEEILASLEQLRIACLDIVWPHAQGYIWQKEAFHLESCTGALRAPDSKTPHDSAAKQDVKQAVSLQQGWKPEVESEPFADTTERRGDSFSQEAVPPHIYGSSRVGDNVEDEWFITWLLLEISKQLPNVSVGEYRNESILPRNTFRNEQDQIA